MPVHLRSVVTHFDPAPGGGLPPRINVGNWGLKKSVKGDYTINELAALMCPRVLEKLNFYTVCLDIPR